MINNFSSLSSQCQQIMLGSLLGDGSIRLDPGYKNARFSVRHSEKYIDYFNWKYQYLKEIGSEKCIHKQKSLAGSKTIKFQSKAIEPVTDFYKLYKPKKTLRRKFLNKLTPLGLAVWWMDDGSLISNTRKGVLCTESFSYEEQLKIVKYFRKVWNVNPRISDKNNDRFRIYFPSVTELNKFLKIIIPYIPVKCMLYKVIMLYKDPNLQERWISELTENSIFKRSEIEKVVEQRKSQLRFFRK